MVETSAYFLEKDMQETTQDIGKKCLTQSFS